MVVTVAEAELAVQHRAWQELVAKAGRPREPAVPRPWGVTAVTAVLRLAMFRSLAAKVGELPQLLAMLPVALVEPVGVAVRVTAVSAARVEQRRVRQAWLQVVPAAGVEYRLTEWVVLADWAAGPTAPTGQQMGAEAAPVVVRRPEMGALVA